MTTSARTQSFGREVDAMLARVDSEAASIDLLEEVHVLKERMVVDQNFTAAAALRDAERQIQAVLRVGTMFTRFGMSILVDRHGIALDPPASVLRVTVARRLENGEVAHSKATMPSEEQLRWFMEGMKVFVPDGRLPEPEIINRGPLTLRDG